MMTRVCFYDFPDGLTGLQIRPSKRGSSAFHIDGLLIEYLSTLNQSGPTFIQANPLVKGADNYFNNLQYQERWAYKDHIIGTPFIILKQDFRPEYQGSTSWAINNNQLEMAHIGMRAITRQRLSLLAKVSHSRNQGIPQAFLPGTPTQWSTLVQIGMPLPWLGGLSLTGSVTADFGKLYPNSVGGYIGFRKSAWGK